MSMAKHRLLEEIRAKSFVEAKDQITALTWPTADEP